MPKVGRCRGFARAIPPCRKARATTYRERTVAFDQERLAIVKTRLGDMLLFDHHAREAGEGLQGQAELSGVSSRTVNMDVGALRKVLKPYGHWRRLQEHVMILSEAQGRAIGRALTLRGAEAAVRGFTDN